MSSIALIVGLGNPGKEYAQTRHNAGAWFIEYIAKHHQLSLQLDNKFHGHLARLRIGNSDCWLLIPNTYMNLSGQAVQAIASFYKLNPQNILIAHDELDFPPGSVKLKQGGGHGGHNGLRDIINRLGSNDFYRLRIGIGHPGHREMVHGHVLNKPNQAEQQQIEQAIAQAYGILPNLLQGDPQKAMQLLHSA